MEMPVSYSIYIKISKKGIVWTGEGRCKRNYKKLCEYKNIEIVEGAVCSDHVHLCVSIPPKHSISEFVGYLKWKSALMIFDKHPEQSTKWSRAFWARGYYRQWEISLKKLYGNIYRSNRKKIKKKKPDNSLFKRPMVTVLAILAF